MSLYKQCYKAFRADEHEWLQNKFIYVTINSTIQRLNELVVPEESYQYNNRTGSNGPIPPTVQRMLVPVEWGLEYKDATFTSYLDAKGKPAFLASCHAELEIPGLGIRMGSGADSSFDPDNAVKSAQAYCLRKAANQFGIAHYLLMNPEKESDLVKQLKNNDPDDDEEMKKAVVMLLDIRKLEPSLENLVGEFGVTVDQVKNDTEIFKKILKQENRI